MESSEQKHTKYTVSVRIKPNINNQPVCLQPYKSNFIKELRPKSIVTYCFDSVFQQSQDNQFIFENSLKKTVGFFLHKRINTTILAYGQTGSGKTYTLFGSKNKSQPGLIDYIVEELAIYITAKGLSAKCSFMQIYKEKVSDLMSSNGVQLRQNSNGDLSLEGLKVFQVKEKEQIMALLKQAHQNKIFGNSYINSQSSRSHVIFSIEIQKRKFNVVDLCGSEVLTYKFDQQQRDQTNSINLSLFTLNAVVNDLAFSQKAKNKHIPFRNSVLTRILKDSLLDMTKSQIYLFCNVSPEQKHQPFSANTLRFGQLTIQIDQAANIQEERVNLSQQKREKKIVSNIVDISPHINKNQLGHKVNWNTTKIKIFDNKVKIYRMEDVGAECNILLLHAYGYGCDGEDWNLHLNFILQNIKANVYSVDFPGFGASEGKKFTSRAQKFGEKQQPLQFMTALFKQFGFSSKKRVIVIGYDLGGAIALSCGLDPKLSKTVEQIIVFHPTWTDSVERVAAITLPTLLFWMPVQTFHLVSAGQKMAKLIKNSQLYKLNIGPYTGEKASGYYDSYAEVMQTITVNFIRQHRIVKEQASGGLGNRERGRIVEEKIQVDVNQEQEILKNSQQAVRQVLQLKQEGKLVQVFETLSKGGPNKPKFVRLALQLPNMKLSIFSWQFCQKYFLFSKQPKNIPDFKQMPFFVPQQQIQTFAKIHLNALTPNNSYLTFDPQGQTGITHRAFVSKQQTEQQILYKQCIKVEVASIKGDTKLIEVPLSDVLYLNSQTAFKKNNLGCLIFQDSVTCNYNSNFMKLKIVQCCQVLQPIVAEMDFSVNDQKLLFQQKQCTKLIFQQLDLRHLVHQGIDNTRYTGIDVGRLAYYGQGNCHHLASVTAAFLLPFGKLLGWEVIFRAGSFFKTGRQIDQKGIPLKGWDGKPKVNVEDHTWLQIRYKPSYQTFVFDPSFAICSIPLEEIYSFEGRMHISGKPLNFAMGFQNPQRLWID